MNIIACIKQVSGTNKVGIDPETGTLKRDGVAAKLNPYDLYALEAAFILSCYILRHRIRLYSLCLKTLLQEMF